MYQQSTEDKKWQEYWGKQKLFEVDIHDASKKKYYCLVMFPYPSSQLHVGHARNYIIGDAVARYKRMKKFQVLSPMGWDAFGLPAENQAIKNKIHPKIWTYNNIETIKKQLKSWGIGYDWKREVTTCDPAYYRWTQWFFIQLFKKGLAYKKKAEVNWCPSCQTVLANEQVIAGECERCSSGVIPKDLEQWFLKITAYADRLLDDLEGLKHWPDRVKLMQKNWIGKSFGVEIKFPIKDRGEQLLCYTTRVDTIFGATFLALSYKHPLIPDLINDLSAKEKAKIIAVLKEIESKPVLAKDMKDFKKEGVFLQRYAINPMTNEEIPIWVTNYVLAEYGTSAIMAVPAHDGRDYDFAKEFGLRVIEVIKPPAGQPAPSGAYEGEGTLVNSGQFSGLSSAEAKERIAAHMEQNNIGTKKVNYKLRDWLISRQRYWGVPIPLVYCTKCGIVPVPDKELPVLLPEVVEFKPTGESPLKYVESFVKAKCPQCKGLAERETDTMDTFVDSSWYFLRYICPDNEKKAFAGEDVNKWLPVDQYIGGIEHAILHLMYSRFFVKFIYDLGLVDFKEPFARLFTQGMIVKDGFKMSKSKGNVVAPDYIIEKYGVDTMRLYILFMGPPSKDAEWQDEGLQGSRRFLTRFDNLFALIKEYAKQQKEPAHEKEEKALLRKLHLTIRKVTDDMEQDFQFNTAISRIMELVNELYRVLNEKIPVNPAVLRESLSVLLRLLAPFTPHICESLWHDMGNKDSIFKADWPEVNKAYLQEESFTIAVLVNGRVRDRIEVASSFSEDQIKQAALSAEKVKAALKGAPVKQAIYVEKKLVNIVV